MKKWEFRIKSFCRMNKFNGSVAIHFAVILLLLSVSVKARYDNQPKILVKSGDIILEAAYDRNISLRLSHDSALLLNNIDIMNKIQHYLTPPSDPRSDGDQVKQLNVLPSTREIRNEVHKLQEDIDRQSQSLSAMRNRTRQTLQLGVIRRYLGQMQRLIGRLNVLEQNIVKDECAEATERCKNGGACYKMYRGFHCDCPDGWTGRTCEQDVDECYLYAGTDMGCQNKAECLNTPGSYKCNCAKGFAGNHCRLRNPICHLYQSAELCGHGTCVPANNQHGYTCICDQGWSRNTTASANSTASLICKVDVNECAEWRNPCHSECINLPGSFKCGSCPAGYTGNGISCMDIDECVSNNGGCSLLPKVRCINTEGSYRCGNCPAGWIGDGHTCDLAPTSSCDSERICHPQAKCEYISTVPTCTCRHGMFGHGFGPDGCHTTPIDDFCENHICKNNGTCLSTGRTTSCLCPEGFSGALCETADGCHPNPCDNGATCRPLANQSFKCVCIRGTTGKHCEVIRSLCGSVQRRSSGGLSYPPEGATEYGPHEKCIWIIRSMPSNILNVTFTSFDVEEDPECSHDWLQIHDGNSLASQLIGRFCGKDLPLSGNILSSQHQLFFWFRSDNATNRPGFHMTWQSQPHICGDILQLGPQDEGVIRSPGYPAKTPPNRECQWSLSAPYGYRFVIRVYEVSLGTLINCFGDTLKIYDADILLQEFCKSSSPQPIKSTSNKLKVHFHTDPHTTDSSFQLHYEVTSSIPHCGGVFTEATGIIVEPMVESTCLYLIQQPLGTQVRFEFLDMDLAQIQICNWKSVEIFDGKSDEDSLLQKSCFYKIPNPVVSTSNFMVVRYISHLDNPKSSPFRAKYTRVCKTTYSGPESGEFATLNYPKAYAEQITCTYHIFAPDGSIVHANFTDFSIANDRIASDWDPMEKFGNDTTLPNPQDESITYVDVYLSSSNKRRFYSGAPMTLISEYNKMTIVFHATTNPENARGFRVKYSFVKLIHGGVFTKDKAYLTKNVSEDCMYIIEAARGKYIRLLANVRMFQEDDSVLIYGNATTGRDYLLKNITTDDRVEEIFHFNIITIFVLKYAYWDGDAYYEFVSSVEACGGSFTDSYGEIKSPNWPDFYTPDLDCVWTISAPLGQQIELVVQNFTLEEYCVQGDSLEIRNGKFENSPLIGRYCMNEIPSRITSFTNNLHLRFKTNTVREGPGFLINWEQTKTGCGGKLTAYKGSIHSPHKPDSGTDLESVVTCAWQIFVVQGSSIGLTVKPSISASEFCRTNRLKIYDGSSDAKSLLHFNCSEVRTDGLLKLYSSSNEVLVVFTPSLESDIVFILDYETNCHITLDHVRGVIESPTVPDQLHCKWDIRAGVNNNLKLVFSHLRLETLHMKCSTDYVEVWDMMNEDVLQKYHPCRELPAPIISVGNRLVVLFVTGFMRGKSNFRAEYLRVGCGEVITNDMGHINSPKYPFSLDLDCEWHFKVPAGKQILLNILELKMDVDTPDCTVDVLMVKEYKNSTQLLLKECSTQEGASFVTSLSNQLYLYFRSGPTKVRKYFKATYNTKEAACGGTFRSKSGVITSPNYPISVKQNYDCKWDIRVPNTYGIFLNFTDFQMSEPRNCLLSTLSISEVVNNTETVLREYCSSDASRTFYAHGSHLVIHFVNIGSHNWGRFSMEFNKQCGGKISLDSGFIRSQASENCVWWFDVPDGTLISLSILRLDCYCHKNDQGKKTCTNGLGFKETPPSGTMTNYSKFYCDEHQSNLVFEVPMLYIIADSINFFAKYSTTQHSCGGLLWSTRGSIAWPSYPGTYPPSMECDWIMVATKGNRIQLQIYEMDIAKSYHCSQEFLQISTFYNIFGVYCGNEFPADIITSYYFGIRFQSSGGSTRSGFKLRWSYAHLNEIVNMTAGVIESPPITMARNEEEPFAWRILIKRDQFITLNFEEYLRGLNLYDGFDDTAMPVFISPSPWRFVSSSNVVYLKTENSNLQHFMIRWNITNTKMIDSNATISTCHSEQFVKPQVHVKVTSPGYPHGYEPNLQCDWIFKPYQETEHIVCELYEVMLEETDDCSADFLSISTSTDLLQWHEMQKLCNSSKKEFIPFQVLHGTPNIKMGFVSDHTLNRTGFVAIIKTKCGSNLTESVGFIDGGKLWPSETTCLWRISVKPNSRIGLQLKYPPIDSRLNNDCSEYAVIYDGIDEYAPIMRPGKICNPQNVSLMLLNSTSNILTIKYNLSPTKPLLPSRWNLTYRAYSQCNEEYRLIPEAATINVTSPNYPNVPHPHTECEWRIVAPLGEIIQVQFEDNFDMNTRFCSSEFLEMFDGPTLLARSLGRFCHKPPMVETTQHVLYMRYLADVSEPRSGFKARISISKCGGSFSDENGVIKSPGYPIPGAYPSSTQCDYAINLPTDSTIRLVTEDVHLPFDAIHPKSRDYLEIIPIGEESDIEQQHIFIYGNTTKGKILHLNVNKVIVRFHTSFKNMEFKGFVMKYNGLGGQCKQTATGDSGYLTMAFALQEGDMGMSGTNCEWKITVPKGQRARLRVLKLNDLKEQNLSEYPKFFIFDDPDCENKILEFDANSYDPSSVIQSSDNIMVVRIYVPHVENHIKAIRAHYSSDEQSPCPQNINADNPSGLIDIQDTQPLFDGLYYCGISIQLNGAETLVFNITTFEVIQKIPAGTKFSMPLMFWDDTILTQFQQNLTNVLQPHNQARGSVRIAQSGIYQIRRLRMDYRRHNCGGSFTVLRNMRLNQPHVTNINYGPIICVWTLRQNFKFFNKINSNLQLSGNFSFADSCEHEFILITHGQRIDGEFSVKICRDNEDQLQNYDLKTQLSHVIYKSQNYKYQSTKFSIDIKQSIICGTELEVLQHSTLVEITDKNYKNNDECWWIFNTAPGFYLTLKLMGSSFIEESPNCTNDYLEFQRYEDGIWIPGSRICGRVPAMEYNATTTRVRVIWRTNEAVTTTSGFFLLIYSHCSVTLNVTSSMQRIESPVKGFDGDRVLQCDYEFESNDPHKLIYVKITYNGKCDQDMFVVNKRDENGIGSNESHCETELEQRAYKYLRLHFNVYEVGYYTIEYALDTCGGNITTSGTTIRSLKQELEDLYAHNMDCVWFVTAPADHSIAVRFKYFETHDKFDYVSVYSGSKIETAKLLAKLSGNLNESPPIIMLDHNLAIINAVSDFSSSAKGFEAQLVFLHNCNERISLTDDSSPITLARNFRLPAGVKYMCMYRITAPQGHRIEVYIKKLQINNVNCSTTERSCLGTCNTMEVFDSVAMRQESIGIFCTVPPTNTPLMSSYEDSMLTFTANQHGDFKFEIVLTMEKSFCGEMMKYELEGNEAFKFTFPQNGELSYGSNIHCTWRLPQAHATEIHFNYIDLQNTSQITGKCVDYIEINQRYASNKYCGHATNYTTYIYGTKVTNNYAEITFHSDESVEGKGFQFIANRATSCNRTYIQHSGFIEYEGSREEGTVCSSAIVVPENYTLNIYVTDVIPERYKCNKRLNKITDLRTDKLLFDLCGGSDVSRTNIFTTTNTVRLDFMDYASVYYNVGSRNATSGCGGIWKNMRGFFTNPPYDNDRNFSECRWDIIVPAPNIIRISFYDFDMGTTANCHLNNIELFDVFHDGSERLLQTICGMEPPGSITSTSNHLALVSKKSPNFDGSGWSLMYSVDRLDH